MESSGLAMRSLRFGDRPEVLSNDEGLRAFNDRHEFTWIHVVVDDVPAGTKLLEEEFGFHPLEVEDALSPHERPALQVTGDTMFLVVPSIVLGGDHERFVEVAFFVRAHGIVTVMTEPLPLLDHWMERCGRSVEATGKRPILLLHALVDAIVDGYFPAVDAIGDALDDIEDTIYASRKINISEALDIKRRLLEIRRQMSPVRDVLNGMLRRDVPLVDEEARVYFQDVFDHTLRVAEVIDMERDILASLLDAHLSIVSNNLNEVMKALTVVSTILMSGAFVAGVYGMNFTHMPELKWAGGYPFSIFLMAAIGFAEFWYFRKRGWI